MAAYRWARTWICSCCLLTALSSSCKTPGKSDEGSELAHSADAQDQEDPKGITGGVRQLLLRSLTQREGKDPSATHLNEILARRLNDAKEKKDEVRKIFKDLRALLGREACQIQASYWKSSPNRDEERAWVAACRECASEAELNTLVAMLAKKDASAKFPFVPIRFEGLTTDVSICKETKSELIIKKPRELKTSGESASKDFSDFLNQLGASRIDSDGLKSKSNEYKKEKTTLEIGFARYAAELTLGDAVSGPIWTGQKAFASLNTLLECGVWLVALKKDHSVRALAALAPCDTPFPAQRKNTEEAAWKALEPEVIDRNFVLEFAEEIAPDRLEAFGSWVNEISLTFGESILSPASEESILTLVARRNARLVTSLARIMYMRQLLDSRMSHLLPIIWDDEENIDSSARVVRSWYPSDLVLTLNSESWGERVKKWRQLSGASRPKN